MEMENEITVLVNSDYNSLHKALIKNGFKMKDKYLTNDIYMIDKSLDLSKLTTLEILQKCAIVREIVGIKKVLLYKYKEYANNGDIIRQSKIECPIKDTNKAISFMEAINYKKLIAIHDYCTEYVHSDIELIVQKVNRKYLFFEVENKCRYIDKEFSSIDEIKDTINKYDLPFLKDNYFVKKAEMILNEKLKRK